MTSSNRAFVYLRVSSNKQLDGTGLDRQYDACTAFADKAGLVVVRTFKEQESGSVDTLDRPVLSELLDLCTDATGVRAVIVERPDRIARDLIIGEVFFRECRERGIRVYTADTGEELVFSDDPSKVMIRQIIGAVSQWEKAQIAKKLLAGRRRTKAQTGFPCGGRPIFGRKPEQKPLVRYILNCHRSGQSCTKIRRALNETQTSLFQSWRKVRPVWNDASVLKVIEAWDHRGEFAVDKADRA